MRILAIASGSVSLQSKNMVPIVGILWRESILEKCFVSYSKVDPTPSELTHTITTLVNGKYFTEKQVKLVCILNNIMAGMGILDLTQLTDVWKTPYIIVSEKKPNPKVILQLIKNLYLDEEFSEVIRKNPDSWIRMENSRLFILTDGITQQEAVKMVSELQIVGHLPEPLRIADIVAKAIL